MVTPVATQGPLVDLNTLFQQMELSRREDKTPNERVLHAYIQQIQQK